MTLKVPETCKVFLAGWALDTRATRCLNPQVLMDPAPRSRENIRLPGRGYLPRPAIIEQRTVDLDILVDGKWTYGSGSGSYADPAAGAQSHVQFLENYIYKAAESGNLIDAEVRDTATGQDRRGKVQLNDMVFTSGTGGRLRVVTFEVLLPFGELPLLPLSSS